MKATIRRARALRTDTTATERLLWKLLRDRRLEGVKFRRQVPLGPYVVDFICFRHRLVIEADGPFHDTEHDERRDAWLKGQAFTVLRFSNGEIQNRSFGVLEHIMETIGRPPLEIRGETPHPACSAGHLLPQGEKDARGQRGQSGP